MPRTCPPPWFPCVLTLGLALGLPGACMADEAEEDFHFRPFWVEPADRVDFGHGHLVGGIDHEIKPEKGTRRRTALPLEATLGLGQGFSLVLAAEGGARSVTEDASHSYAVDRMSKLRYSFPEWEGVHFMVLAGAVKASDGGATTLSTGYSLAVDTAWGTLGWGQTWDRRGVDEGRIGRETAINFFRTGLGPDRKWAAGGEWRLARPGSGENIRYWLAGIGRVVGKGLMADLAVGASSGDQVAHRVTAGLSWFF